MTEGQKTMMLAAIDAAEIWESATGKKEMTLRVGSEFFKTLKELVADRLDYSKHIPVDESCEDCVSREAVMQALTKLGYSDEENGADAEYMSALWDVAEKVKALPPVTQNQQFINKPCISSGVCEHDKQKVLDEIKAEIEEHAKINYGLNTDRAKALCWCLNVIDKYKEGESE